MLDFTVIVILIIPPPRCENNLSGTLEMIAVVLFLVSFCR